MTLHRPAVVSAVAAVTLAIAGLPAPPSTAATSVVTGVTDGQSLSGTVDFTFTAPAPGELEARVDGQPLAGTPMPEPAQFSVLHKGLDPVGFANALIVNEATSQPFTLSSANPDEWLLDPESLDIDLADLHEGENEIRIAAGSTTSAYVLGETPYGTNLDDFTFQQLSLTLPSGDTVAPTQIVYYLPVEVGSSEYTADERAYDPGTIYSIGDGWPGGSGIAAGLPVTVGAVFDLSADQLAPVIRAESYTLDTTTLPDGEHTLEFLADGEVLETLNVVVDNDAPAGPAVLDVLTADREWILQREDSADVVWDEDRLTMTNRVIDSTNMIGWPAVSASGLGNVDVTQTPYLFIDVDVAEGVNRSAWNLRFSNAAGTTTDLAPIFGYGAGSEVPASVTARIDVGTALRSLTVDGTIDLASVTISAVTELDTSVVFNEVYFAAEPKEGDDSAYAPPATRPGSTMTFTQPRPEPDSAFSGIEDGVWYSGTVDFSVTAPEPAGVQLTVDGTELQGVGTPDPAQFSVLHRGLDPNGFANAVVVNDGEARPFATSSANPDEWLETSERITVALDELRVGRNEVRIAAGTSSEHYEPGETVYGTNLDDFDVQQLALLLPDGTEVAPSAVVEYLPEALDSVEYRTEESGYSAEASYAIGDGWPGGSGLAAGLPVGLGAVFELTADQLEPVVRSARYSLDTTTLADGEHTLEFSVAGEVIESLTIATNNASWREAQRPGYSARSSAAVDGGADVSLTVSSPSGNDIDVELVTARPFTVRGTAMTDAGAIPFTAEENAGLTRLGEQVATTTESAKPHHEFTVETGDYEGDVLLAYDGASRSGERVRLSVLDPATGTYDPLATETSTLQTSAVVDTDRYVDDGVITVRAEQVLVGNGSDTFLWASDSQHYSHFEQLAPLYTEVMSYAVEQYEAGEIAYVAHTGDLVEERGRLAEWQVADDAHRILDDAGVPYGVVSGNHDVGNHSAACGVTDCGDYTQFAQYFGSHRYEGTDWYGGGLGDNVSHYDLVTIGDHDFVFLYLGMGREAGDDTVAWVEDVLAQYPNRNVIIGVHEYLDYDGTFYEDLFGDNVPVGQEVYDRIVVPNENVVAVISGHVAGAATEVHQIGDREVVAMLANYQSVNISGLQNSTNTYFTSNGDAFVRLMTIADGALSFTTYSPYLDRYNAFTPAVDTGEVALDLVAPRRELLTAGFSAVPLDSVETVAAVDGLASGATVDERLEDIAPDRGWYAVLSAGPFTTHTPLVDVPSAAVPGPEDPAGTPGVEDPPADENAPVTEDMPDAGAVSGDLATTGVESIHLIALSVLLIAGSAVLLRVRARMRSVE